MKKTTRKIISIMLAAVLSASSFAATAAAEEQSDDTKYPCGLIVEDWERWYPDIMSESDVSTFIFCDTHPYDTGDVNGDGKITANDARLCLRAAAKLETLDYEADKAAHVFNEWKRISAADARAILRAAAQIEPIYKEDTTVCRDEGLEIYGLMKDADGKYTWICECDRMDELAVATESFPTEYGKDDESKSVMQVFAVVPKSIGEFIFHFKKVDTDGAVYENVYVKITVLDQTFSEWFEQTVLKN